MKEGDAHTHTYAHAYARTQTHTHTRTHRCREREREREMHTYAGQGNNLTVIKAHSIEHVTQVLGTEACVRKPAVWGDAFTFGSVSSASLPWNVWTTHHFDGVCASKSVDVGVRQVWVLCFDVFKQVSGNAYQCIRAGERECKCKCVWGGLYNDRYKCISVNTINVYGKRRENTNLSLRRFFINLKKTI